MECLMRGGSSIKMIEFVLSILLVWGLVTYVAVFILLLWTPTWIFGAVGCEAGLVFGLLC